MRVLVTGDRFYDDSKIVSAVLDGLYLLHQEDDPYGPFVVIEGQCPKGGADLFAEEWAKRTGGVDHRPVPADWDTHHKAAGPIRNRKMLKEERPDVVVAFHDDLEHSKGTKDMVTIADKAGVPVYHIRRIGNGKLF